MLNTQKKRKKEDPQIRKSDRRSSTHFRHFEFCGCAKRKSDNRKRTTDRKQETGRPTGQARMQED